MLTTWKYFNQLILDDERTHQLPCLMLIVHMFANFHNVIFDELKEVLSVSDEVLGREAQKICVAVYQNSIIQYVHSILREFLRNQTLEVV